MAPRRVTSFESCSECCIADPPSLVVAARDHRRDDRHIDPGSPLRSAASLIASGEDLLCRSEYLKKFELLAFRALGIHHRQALELAFGYLVRVAFQGCLLACLL